MRTQCFALAAAATIVLMADCATTRAADVAAKAVPPKPPMPVILLRLDDLSRSGAHGQEPVSARWRHCVDFLAAEGVKASLGIIGNSLEEDAPAYFNWIRDLYKKGLTEFWNHGYEDKADQFQGPSMEEQKAALEKTQRLAREKLGLTLRVFGPYGNNTDAGTEAALAAIPEIWVWFYGPDTKGKQVSLKHTIDFEQPTFVPNFEKFKADFEKRAAEQPYVVLQGHPNQWDDARFAAFVQIVKFLKERGGEFMTVSDYLVSDQMLITRWKQKQLTPQDFAGKPEEEWVKANFQEGDEIWSYCSPPLTWQNMAGSEGFAIFRNGWLVANRITRMN